MKCDREYSLLQEEHVGNITCIGARCALTSHGSTFYSPFVIDNCGGAMIFYSIPPDTGFGKESEDANGICEDTLHFVDAGGYTCKSNVGYDCLDPDVFQSWGYSYEQWQEVIFLRFAI